MSTRTMRGVRIVAVATAAGALLLGSLGSAKGPKALPTSEGTTEEGELRFTLRRGANIPDETLVMPTANNCKGEVDVHLSWNEQENWVRLHLTGKKALIPNPSVDRTEGVDWHANPFWPEPIDYQNGRYQLWMIMLGEPVFFYYSAITLDLLGSEFEFPNGPPPDSIPIRLPIGYVIPTNFIIPDQKGDVDFVQEWQYDQLTRGDLPQFSHTPATFIPHSLCTAHPFRYERGSSRPWISPPRPASEGRSFKEFLRAGLQFDMTVEPPSYFVFPPLVAQVAVVSQTLNAGGHIPEGWTWNFERAFGNLAPVIEPWEAAGTCEPWYKPKRDRDYNICQ